MKPTPREPSLANWLLGDPAPIDDDAPAIAEAPPEAAVDLRGGRPPTMAFVICLGMAQAVVVALFVWWVSTDDPNEQAGQTSAPALQRPPTGLASTGSYVETRILSTGSLQVTQWIDSRAPLSTLRLLMPASAQTQAVVAQEVQVTTEAGYGYGPVTVRQSGIYDFPVPVRLLRIRYALKGVTVRSPSVPGRLLVRAVSLKARYDGRSGATRVKLVGGQVRAAACTYAVASATARPCGRQAGKGWVVELRGSHRDDGVMAQVDLDWVGSDGAG